jgi:uncharacterized protein DUF3224
MPKVVTSSFENDSWDEVPNESWKEDTLSRASIVKTFTGEIVGTSKVESIMLRTADNGPMVYVGVERFDCTIDGKTGGFVLIHDATMVDGVHDSSWRILEGTGTGELAGIAGTGEITPKHDFILTYELG